MIFRGWARTSLIDAPGHMATVLFTAGCNFRCPYCHNPGLVLGEPHLPVYTEEQLFDFLARRQGFIDAVVISGGEPTLQPDLLPFLSRLRGRPVWIKLDTNGSHPAVLREILSGQLVDYVAMDIKSSPERYPAIAGSQANVRDIDVSIGLLKHSAIDYEFRTTVIDNLHQETDIIEIAQWLAPCKRYILQRFNPGIILDVSERELSAVPADKMKTWADAARVYISEVALR
ncbi:MAG: anaerobic ribonucleoside-triphosphate reductase activating protein [Anaerolineae bacterium]|nr:anaerobic ribonucleoside-triphosphate reductase activating protein [Anaerolineae bacterium]